MQCCECSGCGVKYGHSGKHIYCAKHDSKERPLPPPPFPTYKPVFIDSNSPRKFSCVKCSHDIVRVEFKYGTSPSEEKLSCTCSRCDYKWSERPSDHKVTITMPTHITQR